ncbi:MAG: hypothetical protein KA205_08465 [Acidobacteria bacterium]|nr:hypothetical protein [Acidobacteriota bacterium]
MYQKSMLAILGCSVALLALTAAGQPTAVSAASAAIPQQSDGYVGADGCKECHTGQYDAWKATKHERTLGRLSAADREGDKCIRCHVTGSPEMIKADGAKPRYPGVQCENCHGAGAVHVEQARAKAIVKGAIVKTPEEDACLKCHTDASPHYKPFFYNALKGMVHLVKK